MRPILDSNQITVPDLDYRTFYDSLSEKLGSADITSLNVLGKEFFMLIDHFTSQLLIDRPHDHLMLDVPRELFLWEIQVFLNRLFREMAGPVFKLRSWCETCLEELKDEDLYQKFSEKIQAVYSEHFFVTDCNNGYLV